MHIRRNLTGITLFAITTPLATIASLPAMARQATPTVAQLPASAPVPVATASQNSTEKSPREIGYLTAERLAEKCNNTSASDIGYCYAYIAAVHDTMRAYEIWLGEKEFCMPTAISQRELKQSFITYITAYPDNKQGQAASVIAIALKQTYPCTGAPSPSPEPQSATGKIPG